MNQYRVSPAARSDLDEIWFYIAKDNPDAADCFIRALISSFPTLATFPEMGRLRGELSPNLRSLPFRRYVIFYRPLDKGVEIVRVLHGARDLPALFE